MKKGKFLCVISLLFASAIALSNAALLVNAWSPTQGKKADSKQEIEKEYLPITDYNGSESVSALSDKAGQEPRRARSSRYDNRRPQPISELPVGTEELPMNTHWGWQLTTLPISQSDAVVIGDILDAQAHLSLDRTGIYSEFKIQIKEVLNDRTQASLFVGEQITVEREGGAVRFPSGRIQQYRVTNQFMPRVGRQFLLFLRHNEDGQDYSILTGYELRGNRVTPLDNLEQFNLYKGTEQTTFLNTVREAIAHPTQTNPRTGGEVR